MDLGKFQVPIGKRAELPGPAVDNDLHGLPLLNAAGDIIGNPLWQEPGQPFFLELLDFGSAHPSATSMYDSADW